MQSMISLIYSSHASLSSLNLLSTHTGPTISYVRPTLVSYGGSCKVLTAYSKDTRGKYAVKIIPKDPKKIEEQRRKVLAAPGL